jgi:hypothetical protein
MSLNRKRDTLEKLEEQMRRSWTQSAPRERFLRLEVALWRARQEAGEAERARREAAEAR